MLLELSVKSHGYDQPIFILQTDYIEYFKIGNN